MTLSAIGFDADDTLWENERYFRAAQAQFEAEMAQYISAPDLEARLLLIEARNVQLYGYGVKSFTLSMMETAIEVTEAQAPGKLIANILAIGREVFSHPVEVLPHAGDTLEGLAGRYRLILVTKGDIVDQERKLNESGLADFFDHVEIVSQKHVQTYRRIFDRHADGAQNAAMVGNSLRSDVLPMLDAGGVRHTRARTNHMGARTCRTPTKYAPFHRNRQSGRVGKRDRKPDIGKGRLKLDSY